MKIEGKQTDVAQESLHASAYSFALRSNRDKVLDVGVGDITPIRRAILWIDASPNFLVGVDIDKETLKTVTKRPEISLVAGDGLSLLFRDNSFSCVISSQVIEHISENNHYRFVQELSRVTSPNGRIFISTMNKSFPYNVRGHKSHVSEFNTTKALAFKEILKQFGEAKLYVITPSKRFINAQSRRAKFWFFRSIKDLVPRKVSEFALTLLTLGEVYSDLDMREDFDVKEFSDLKEGELFTDFIFEITKSEYS